MPQLLLDARCRNFLGTHKATYTEERARLIAHWLNQIPEHRDLIAYLGKCGKWHVGEPAVTR